MYDNLVIGSGIAGLFFALKTAKENKSVIIVTKSKITESNSFYAQGGISSVMDKNDKFEYHTEDTLIAGGGICNKEVVEMCVENAPRLMNELIELGVNFSKKNNEFDLGKEGGHSQRRVLHAGDITGNEIIKVLVKNVLENPNIKVLEEHIAIDLITGYFENGKEKYCMGAYILDKKNEKVIKFLAKNTILATGGAGKVYLYTSNPDTATGDGIAMAYRSGANIANMEFIQFHPTCLFHPLAKSFLISEALRGEGGILKLKNGDTFMEKYHHLKSLAPRDVVAKAIDYEMKKSGDDCVFLDMTHLDGKFLETRFPNIFAKCLSFGIDMRKEMIPVVPAAHYTCGGVVVDKNGESSIKHLFAIGEVSCSGLHGANRLASNSLLEGLVFGETASKKVINYIDTYQQFEKVWDWHSENIVTNDEAVLVAHTWDEIRRFMWNYVGIVRSNKRLLRAKRRIRLIKQEINAYYWSFFITQDLIELRNIADVAEMIIENALMRKESRGLHTTVDYPNTDDVNFKKDVIISRYIIQNQI